MGKNMLDYLKEKNIGNETIPENPGGSELSSASENAEKNANSSKNQLSHHLR